MSLLIEALKRAELAKKRGQPSGHAPQPSPLSLEPAAADPRAPRLAGPRDQSRPETNRSEDVASPLDEGGFTGEDRNPAPGRPATTTATPAVGGTDSSAQESSSRGRPPSATNVSADARAAQEAARNAFAAKGSGASRNSFLLAVLSFSIIAAAALGIHLWLQLRPVEGIALSPPPTQSTIIGQTSTPAAGAPAATATTTRPNQPTPAQRSLKDGQGTTAKRAAEASLTASARPPAPSDPETSPIRITKTRTTVQPLAADAYALLQAGDDARAKEAYLQLIERDPRSVEALHGLAAISLREGRIDQAQAIYSRVLELDPRDAIANANLIALRSDADPIASESRLRNLLASQPDVPLLNFALGNLYAAQGRWSEAQSAYFKAFSLDSDNPDYAFNLAVSLDHLRQDKLARQYYERALGASERRPANFDRNHVIARLRELSR